LAFGKSGYSLILPTDSSEDPLFNLGQERFFIAVKNVDRKVWEVVELTQENKERIVTGQPCEHSNLHFDEMNCLNIKG
jgi:hypothetical protein